VVALALFGYCDAGDERMAATVDAVRRELGAGPLVARHGSPAEPREGAFLASSFWVVAALARAGRVDEAAALMDELVGLANDAGLLPEEVDFRTGGRSPGTSRRGSPTSRS
jgi:GH15 family glucan-1,4-alpha-glucosidase